MNGVRRALTTPRRLFGLLFAVVYYLWLFARPGMWQTGPVSVPSQMAGKVQFPGMAVLDAAVFALFAVVSLFMMLGVYTYRGGFRPADVDVLFATPVPPKAVLVFRMVREYLATLLIPLLLALLFFRPVSLGWQSLFRDVPHPETAGFVFRSMAVSWMLMALCWVAISYASSLFVNRSDNKSDLNKRILIWGTCGLVAALGAFLWLNLGHYRDVDDLVALSRSPVLRIGFFIATAATDLTLAPLAGSIWMAVFGAGLMIGVILLALRLALTQVGWLYDQAAVKGFAQQETRKMQARGDLLGVAIQRARSGKAKPQRRSWIHGLRIQGPIALLWKEYFIQKRGMTSLLIVLMLPAVLTSMIPILMASDVGDRIGPIFFLIMQCFAAFTITLNMGITGSMEALRRVDCQKPLPFSAFATCVLEIAGKAVWATAISFVGVAVALIVRPGWFWYLVGSAIYVPTLAFVISAAVFLVIMLFPDTEDNTQRPFHNLLAMIAIIIAAGPATVIGGVLLAVKVAPPIAALPAAIVNVGIALLVAVSAGALYAGYNPSE